MDCCGPFWIGNLGYLKINEKQDGKYEIVLCSDTPQNFDFRKSIQHATYMLKLKGQDKWISFDPLTQEDWGNVDTTDFTKDPIEGYTGRCRYGNDEDGYKEIEKVEMIDPEDKEISLDDFCQMVDDYIYYHCDG